MSTTQYFTRIDALPEVHEGQQACCFHLDVDQVDSPDLQQEEILQYVRYQLLHVIAGQLLVLLWILPA